MVCIFFLENKDSDTFSGKVKLEILYNIRHQSLTVMVRHVKNLVSITLPVIAILS